MVMELLVNPGKAEGNPWQIGILGFAYAFASVFIALWIFKNYVSIVMLTLTIIASVPLVRAIISIEEKKEMSSKTDKMDIKSHAQAVLSLFYLFAGYTAAFAAIYVFMPSNMIERIFSAQLETIISVTSAPTGEFIGSFSAFNAILMNNLKILLFFIAFSFFYGAGAIFIMTWNASVMATAIGSFIRNNLFYATGFFGYFQVTMVALLQYLIHGIPEIIAYLIGAIASGMISFSLINHDFMGKNFRKVLNDSIKLTGIALAMLIIAAAIEVYITPLII